MSDLIVNFTQARKVGFKARSGVRFSPDSTVRFYAKPNKDDASLLYYTKSDYQGFKKESKLTVQEIHRRYHARCKCPEEQDSDDIFQGCVLTGVENLLTPTIMKKSVARRVGRLQAVLDEQDRQVEEQGYCDPDKLASVSRRYSKASMQRAEKIGMMQRLL